MVNILLCAFAYTYTTCQHTLHNLQTDGNRDDRITINTQHHNSPDLTFSIAHWMLIWKKCRSNECVTFKWIGLISKPFSLVQSWAWNEFRSQHFSKCAHNGNLHQNRESYIAMYIPERIWILSRNKHYEYICMLGIKQFHILASYRNSNLLVLTLF